MVTQTQPQTTTPTSALNQYYSSSDCTVFIENPLGTIVPVMLDKIAGIEWTENLTSTPIYGIGNSKFGFISQGNISVSGVLYFNFTHPNYLATTLNYVLKGNTNTTTVPTTQTLATTSKMSNTQFAQLSSSQTKTISQYTTGLSIYPQYFMIRVILNNAFLFNTDQNKEFLFKGVKIVGSSTGIMSQVDDQIMFAYQFIAREVLTPTI